MEKLFLAKPVSENIKNKKAIKTQSSLSLYQGNAWRQSQCILVLRRSSGSGLADAVLHAIPLSAADY